MGGDKVRVWASMVETRVERSKVTGEGVVAEVTLCSVWETKDKGQYIYLHRQRQKGDQICRRGSNFISGVLMFLEDSQVEMLGDQQGLGI